MRTGIVTWHPARFLCVHDLSSVCCSFSFVGACDCFDELCISLLLRLLIFLLRNMPLQITHRQATLVSFRATLVPFTSPSCVTFSKAVHKPQRQWYNVKQRIKTKAQHKQIFSPCLSSGFLFHSFFHTHLRFLSFLFTTGLSRPCRSTYNL